MVMPAIAPFPSLSVLPTIQTDKTKIAGQGQASSLSLFPRFPLSLSCRRLAARWILLVYLGHLVGLLQ